MVSVYLRPASFVSFRPEVDEPRASSLGTYDCRHERSQPMTPTRHFPGMDAPVSQCAHDTGSPWRHASADTCTADHLRPGGSRWQTQLRHLQAVAEAGSHSTSDDGPRADWPSQKPAWDVGFCRWARRCSSTKCNARSPKAAVMIFSRRCAGSSKKGPLPGRD